MAVIKASLGQRGRDNGESAGDPRSGGDRSAVTGDQVLSDWIRVRITAAQDRPSSTA
jgi:high-affinity K+ transport system ATPase subunit B